jgi:signal transduction histidine kinase
MVKFKYHPLVKFAAFLLLILAIEVCAFSLWEIAASFESYLTSLTASLFHYRLYFPVLLGWAIFSAVSFLFLLVYLCSAAGRTWRDDSVRLTAFYKIPLDLWLFLAFCAFALLIGFTINVFNDDVESIENVIAYYSMFFFPTAGVLLVSTLMSITARIRAGGWWRNNVITYVLRLAWWLAVRAWGILCRVLRFVWRGLRRVCRKIIGAVSEISAVPLAILFAISAVVFFLIAVGTFSGFIFIFASVYTVTGILLGAVFTRRLEKGAQKLAEGDLESRVDTSNLFGAYRRHAAHLNHICEGMSNAVEAQLRSERMKTELITNVSHDIKTPLTSLINYIDLMKKESLENETVKEYLDIMDRQSTRLKKLIEDLMEVSKTATGNVAVEMMPTDVGVLLEQSTGEYRERLAAANLTLCVDNKVKNGQIMADGKLLWRVFDNLLGNICKYSMPGTRVYLNVAEAGGEMQISLRNISLYSLNITSEELMERFVRGDRSRHTEGSGLGLSIAKNLVELQKGKLEVIIDGDLFKAVMTFPMISK